LRRGEVWTVSGAGYAGKPRPAVIVQDDLFEATASVTICVFTTDPTDAPLLRIRVEPHPENGLRVPSTLMVDKITTVPRTRLGARLGSVSQGTMERLNRALFVFLGIAG